VKNSSRRRSLIIAGVAVGALLLFVVAGVVFYSRPAGRTSSDTAPFPNRAAGVFHADPAGGKAAPAGGKADLADGKAAPADGSSELPSPGYIELASLLVNEHRTEWQAPFNSAPASPPPLNFNDKPSLKDEVMSNFNRAFNLSGSTYYVPIVQPDKLFPVTDRLGKTKNPVIRLALDKLEEGQREGENTDKKVDDHVETMKKQVDIVTQKARRGEYIRTIVEQGQRMNLDGRLVPEPIERTVNQGEAAIAEASRAAREAEQSAPEYKRSERLRLLEEARVKAWKAMEPRLAEVYPPNPPSADLVKIQIQPLQFTAVNTGRRALTNVSLIVQVYHFLTSPDETDYRVYFIPRWDVGQPIHLSLTLWRDPKQPVPGRPPFAYPGYSGENWLNGLGGVVKVRSVAWAAEANQPEKITSFPAHADDGARWEMKIVGDSVAAMVRGWRQRRNRVPQQVPQAAGAQDRFTLPADAFQLQSARRILTYATAGSEPARQAKLLLENPEAIGNQKDNALIDQVAKGIEPGARFEGEWRIQLSDFTVNVPRAPRAAKDNKNNHGKIVLRIESRDLEAKTITATLQDADHPELQRVLKGTFKVDYAGRVMMNFPSPILPQHNPGTPLTPQELKVLQNAPDYWNLLRTPQQVNIWLERGGALQLQTYGGQAWTYYATLRPSGG
jgi:hypothetical protein